MQDLSFETSRPLRDFRHSFILKWLKVRTRVGCQNEQICAESGPGL